MCIRDRPELAEEDPNRNFSLYGPSGLIPKTDLTDKQWEKHSLAGSQIAAYWEYVGHPGPPTEDLLDEQGDELEIF